MNFLTFIVWMAVCGIPFWKILFRVFFRKEDIKFPALEKALLLLAGGVATFFIFDQFVDLYVDILWFEEVEQVERFWTVLKNKWFYFGLGAAVPLLFMFLNIAFIAEAPDGEKDRFYRFIMVSFSGFITFCGAIFTSKSWDKFLLYENQHAFGIADPIFDKDIAFYVFALPVLNVISSYLFWLVVAALLMVGAIYFRYSQLTDCDWKKTNPQKDALLFRGITHISILGIVFMGVNILNTFIARWDLLFSNRGAVFGAGWTDVNIQLYAYDVFMIVLGVCIVILSMSAVAHSLKVTSWGTASGFCLCLLFWLIGVEAVPALFQNYKVARNEIQLESEYIKHNIHFTKEAYGLSDDKITTVDFPVNPNIDQSLLNENRETLDNIRLWDFRVLQSTYSQTQVFRTYYSFSDVDVVRYTIDGKLIQLMCSAREMDQDRLMKQSKTWQNLRFVYTHGFGMVANPVNVFLPPEGMPQYWLKDIPPVAKYSELEIKQPRIYFGEETTTHVFVNSGMAEFDYPKGEHNETFHYDGTGGIKLGSGLRKFAFAWKFDGLGMLTAAELKPKSRIMFDRDIMTRIQKIAPFLGYDPDPYQVIADGAIWYICDAFTTSNYYPYSERMSSLNYIRNSVKVVINAYTGKVNFYVFDEHDPIIKSYRKIFSKMFKTAAEMPASLRQHIRYPESLMKIQGQMYSLYHMEDPTVFYNKEDAWAIANQVTADNKIMPVLPYYVVMRIPGEEKAEFVLIQPFTPFSSDPTNHPRNNMVGWLAGRCDGEHYGQLLVYQFPKDTFIPGPQQIGIRINQDEVISKDISLWNQQGSQVIFGNLLVLPLSQFRLFYVQPIYLQAESGKMPELKRVVLAAGDRLAYGTSFEDAMQKLLGMRSWNTTASKSAKQPAETDTKGLIRQASDLFHRYQQLTGEGKLAEAGQTMDELKQTLEMLLQRQ